MKAILAASFDPPTLGHEDLIRRASKIFDKLYVGIGKNSKKNSYLQLDSRRFLLGEICKEYSNVEVITFDGLLVEYCRGKGIGIIVRGLRATLDFEYELSMAHVNRKLMGEVDTIFLPTEVENSFVSSSMVREIHGHGGDISAFVSKAVEDYLVKVMVVL
jgi:pantetheine-phosphate adenylyltransferase